MRSPKGNPPSTIKNGLQTAKPNFLVTHNLKRPVGFTIESSVLNRKASVAESTRFDYGLSAQVLKERRRKDRKSANMSPDQHMNKDLASLDDLNLHK